jgi:flagellar FliL protein
LANGTEKSGSGKKGSTLWIVLICIVAAMGSSYAMLRFMGGGNTETSAKKEAPERGPVFEAGEFTVDLVPEGTSHLLRASIVLQTTGAKVAKELEERQAEVKDIIVTILRGRTPSSMTGRQGMESLRREIRDSINEQIAAGAVSDVYFPDLVMQ